MINPNSKENFIKGASTLYLHHTSRMLVYYKPSSTYFLFSTHKLIPSNQEKEFSITRYYIIQHGTISHYTNLILIYSYIDYNILIYTSTIYIQTQSHLKPCKKSNNTLGL